MEESKDEPWRSQWRKIKICEENLELTRINKSIVCPSHFNSGDVSELQAVNLM